VKKLLLTATMLLLPFTANAADIIPTSSLKGPQGKLVQNIISSSVTTKFVAKQTGGCGEAVATFESATGPVAIVWSNSMYRNSKKANQNCIIKHDEARAVMQARVAYDICVTKGINLVKGTDMAFGNNKFNPQVDQLRDLNTNGLGIEFRTVTYRGSGPVAAAVANGDVDIGIIATPSAKKAIEAGSIDCLYSTGSDRYGQMPMSVFVPDTKLANYNLGMMVFTRNMSKADHNALVSELEPLEEALVLQDMFDVKVELEDADTKAFIVEAKSLKNTN
jgi:hypothetical protein|tara:strand:- start:188 stop:1018 length:831 start_codon:yes stop_codon:yes gene_type:complete